MVENGSAVEIDLGDKAKNYLPNAIDGFTYNGKLYGLPLAVEILDSSAIQTWFPMPLRHGMKWQRSAQTW